MPKHTNAEFIKFLNAVERTVPAGKIIHAVVDYYETHKHPNVLARLAEHPRRVFHSSQPTACGSMPLKASSRLSPVDGSGAACPSPSQTSRTLSAAK
jgi:hypothetical protein